MKALLEKLMKRQDLTADEVRNVTHIIATGQADPVQTAAFLVLMSCKGETVQEIKAMVEVMRSHAIKVDVPYTVVDVVGTGGDGYHTVNISTSAAILSAACGAKVAKHGSTSVSSKSGSSDVLTELGIEMLAPSKIAACIDQVGIAFMFAPKFHPAMRHVVPVRKTLQVRTIFNIMGPLLNPAGAKRMCLGVYSPDLLDVYGQVLHGLGVEHALVVCGAMNMDELSTIGVAQAVEVTREGIKRFEIDPAKMGIPAGTLDALRGGVPAENAKIIRNIFAGGDAANAALGQTIALNAAAVLYVYGIAASIEDGYKLALNKLVSGDALVKLDEFVQATKDLDADYKKQRLGP